MKRTLTDEQLEGYAADSCSWPTRELAIELVALKAAVLALSDSELPAGALRKAMKELVE